MIIVLILIVASVIACSFIYSILHRPQFTMIKPVEIFLKSGLSFQEITEILRNNKLLSNDTIFKMYMIATGKHRRIKAGYYLFDKSYNIIELSDKLMQGQTLYLKITIPEGSNLYDIEGILRRNGLLDKIDYAALLKSKQLLDELHVIDPKIQYLEGYLFPETYFLTKGETALILLRMMIKEFEKRYLSKLKIRAHEMDASINDIVIMASMIEKETGYIQEKPLIASVFYNRLRIHMRLQCDPTVLYSFYMNGKFPLVLIKDDLEIDSPYNTYVNAGLPPTPICNPGSDSLLAAMYPAESSYLYFVSKHNGTHYFSKNLDEHLKAVSTYNR